MNARKAFTVNKTKQNSRGTIQLGIRRRGFSEERTNIINWVDINQSFIYQKIDIHHWKKKKFMEKPLCARYYSGCSREQNQGVLVVEGPLGP